MNNENINPAEIATVNRIILRKGGYREKALLMIPHEYVKTGTWSADHKVIEILELTPGDDGYCAGCAVDIVTRAIVG